MTAPYVKEFEIGGWLLTSVVIDQDEFNDLVTKIPDHVAPKEAKKAMISEGQVKLIYRGQDTKYLFDKYDVKTDYLGIIVRGKGQEIMSKILNQ